MVPEFNRRRSVLSIRHRNTPSVRVKRKRANWSGNGRFCRTRCVILKGRKWWDEHPSKIPFITAMVSRSPKSVPKETSKLPRPFGKTQLNRAVCRTKARSFDSPTACNSTVINREIVNISEVVRLNTRSHSLWSLGQPNPKTYVCQDCRDLSEKLNSTGRSAEQTHVVLILQYQYAGFP